MPWHDAALLELSLDRRDPGEGDEVRLRVAWPHGEEAALLFRGCYAMTADMNFGIIAAESIASATLVNDDSNLPSLRERWSRLGVPLEVLSCYRFDMSSTGSVVLVYATDFKIE